MAELALDAMKNVRKKSKKVKDMDWGREDVTEDALIGRSAHPEEKRTCGFINCSSELIEEMWDFINCSSKLIEERWVLILKHDEFGRLWGINLTMEN
ncbi:uncharacterized protein A4U43_C01F30420 [Asparagus officinalis]|uniref:Uncharacterized protein n=1 Tax=Asparagus officinalis TaxID=4686 RepID=A0A5P1FX13_ASPOF|nr:uncharacterized protein A4U43_C01F30420 [Asparagus officinalis]